MSVLPVKILNSANKPKKSVDFLKSLNPKLTRKSDIPTNLNFSSNFLKIFRWKVSDCSEENYQTENIRLRITLTYKNRQPFRRDKNR